jgi:hypothetical protein
VNEVRCERSGERILLGSAAPLSGVKKAIPGAYFRKDKIWSVPLDLETCVLLREQYGQRLKIGPALTSWARTEKARRAGLAETAAAPDAPLDRLHLAAPGLYAAMGSRPYQKAAVRFVVDAKGRDGRRRALIADTVGLGKTAEALGSIVESGASGPFLILCPKTAVETAWRPEIARWLPDAQIVTLPDGRAKRENILNSLAEGTPRTLAKTFIIVHPAVIRTQTWWECPVMETDLAGETRQCSVRTKYRSGIIQELDCLHDAADRRTIHEHEYPQLFEHEYGAVVVDESDQILIRLTGTPNLQRRGAEMLGERVRPGGLRIAMSGTPFRSKPHQIWSTLNWLDPKRYSGKWRFIEKYWGLGGYSGYEVGKFLQEREPMLIDELRDIMIRRTREEVRADLPAKVYADNRLPTEQDLPAGIWLDLSPKQAKAYEGIVKAAEAELEGGTLRPIGVLAEYTRMKQFATATGRLAGEEFEFLPEGGKYDWIVEHLRQIGLPDRPAFKIVIASQFTRVLNAFAEGVAKELKLKPGRIEKITGEVKDRAGVVERFEDPESGVDILFLNTKAGGSAITLDAADEMVICDETWVDDEQQQLEGRIDNRNPERKIAARTYYYLRSRGTVEELIARNNAAAKVAGGRILDPARFAAEKGFRP